MILERADGTFSSVGPMFSRGDTLERDLIALESILEILRTFVVKNVQLDRMSLKNHFFVN